MGKILEKWMNENNIRSTCGYEMADWSYLRGAEEEIKYSDLLLGKRIKVGTFLLAYRDEPGQYSLGHSFENDRTILSEFEFLEHVKGKLSEYKKWYAVASYPKQEPEKQKKSNPQKKLF